MIKRSQAAIIEQEIKALSDEALFDEWRELFTRFRRDGKLPNPDRDRFHFLSKELAARGVLT
mgnify:FL=1